MSLDETLIRAFHAHLAAGDLNHGDASAAHEIFQTSTINALLESVYDDRRGAGHVLGFTTSQMRVRFDVTSQLHLSVPKERAFLEADLAMDSAKDIRKAET